MTKKRASGEGTIYKMTSGKWRAQVSGPLGNRISFVGLTQAECQIWLTKTKSNHMGGIDLQGGHQKLEDFIEIWLHHISHSRSRNTVRIYKETLLPIYEYLGNLPLSKIQPVQIQTTYSNMLADGKSAYSVKAIHKVLHTAFAFAKKLRLISNNPVSNASPPKHYPKKMSCFDTTQVQALLFGAQVIEDKYFPLYYLALNTGMRQGKLLGLKWKDIDWEISQIKVDRQLTRYDDGSFEFRKPKSESSIRKIDIGTDVLEMLRLHKTKQLAKSIEGKSEWNKHQLVFPSLTGTPVNASNLRRSFRKLLDFTCLPQIRFHDLRHTAATLMLNYGTPIPIVSQRLGHSKVSMTLDIYAHAIPSKQTEAAELMQSLLRVEKTPVAHRLHTEQKISSQKIKKR